MFDIDKKDFGCFVAELRKEKGFTQKELAEKLNAITVKIKAKAGTGGRLFGAVTSKEVAEELSKQSGTTIEKKKVVLEDIKSYGTFTVKAKLGYEITGDISVLVVEG